MRLDTDLGTCQAHGKPYTKEDTVLTWTDTRCGQRAGPSAAPSKRHPDGEGKGSSTRLVKVKKSPDICGSLFIYLCLICGFKKSLD